MTGRWPDARLHRIDITPAGGRGCCHAEQLIDAPMLCPNGRIGIAHFSCFSETVARPYDSHVWGLGPAADEIYDRHNRAVDSTGQTIDFLLTAKRDAVAAKRFFRKTLLDPANPQPRIINVDKNRAYPTAVEELKWKAHFGAVAGYASVAIAHCRVFARIPDGVLATGSSSHFRLASS
jgi:hypothetical protein